MNLPCQTIERGAPKSTWRVNDSFRDFRCRTRPRLADEQVAGSGLTLSKLSVAASLSVYTQVNVAQVEDLFKVKAAVKRVTLGNGMPADEVSYERTFQYPQGPVTLSLRQYFVVVGQTAWVLSFTIAQSKLATYGDTILKTAMAFNPK